METKLYEHVTDGGAIYLTTVENDLGTAVVRLDGEPVLLTTVTDSQEDLDEQRKLISKQIRLIQQLELGSSGRDFLDEVLKLEREIYKLSINA